MPGLTRQVVVRALRRARGRGGSPALGARIPDALIELERSGPAPLDPSTSAATARLRIAVVLPSFRRGGGGHQTIVHLARGLRAKGHEVSLWLEDFEDLHAADSPAHTRQSFVEFFAADGLELHLDFSAWHGADVTVATGWQTVPRVQLLPGSGSRAYLVQDHEPDFYGASAEGMFAAETYRQGLHCIAASPWLAELLQARYGADASHFDLAVDHRAYHPASTARRDDLIVFYARAETPRRAVPLGLLALREFARHRPGVEIALFGSGMIPSAGFPSKRLPTLGVQKLASLYRTATIGMAFSLTNPSLVTLEMMACGLPCIELDTEPVRASFGAQSALALAKCSPLEICSTLEHLLDDPTRRAEMARQGPAMTRMQTWDAATSQVERGLRAAIDARS